MTHSLLIWTWNHTKLCWSRDARDAGGDVTVRYWTTQAGSCPLNMKPALDDEEGDSGNIDDEDKITLTFKYTVIIGAGYFIQF